MIKNSREKIFSIDDKQWGINIDSHSFMQPIEFNKENHLILIQIYNILAELKNQGKHVTLCKVLAHIGIEGNVAIDTSAKEGISMSGTSTTWILRGIERSSRPLLIKCTTPYLVSNTTTATSKECYENMKLKLLESPVL